MTGEMTKGNPFKILITFGIPMILGNMFQQLYSTTDAVIVGKFIGKKALAVVGVANPIMSIAIFFIFGICIGTSVLMSQLFGAGKFKNFKREVSTALIVGTIFTFVMSFVCFFLSKWVLVITGTPKEIIEDADIFLKIIFGDLIFSFFIIFILQLLDQLGIPKLHYYF